MTRRVIVKKLPRAIRQVLKAAYGTIPPRFRLGRAFWETYHFLQQSQWWDQARLREYQMRELERLLAHCYENVPYYRRLFDERGLKPADIQSLSDLTKLPCLGKDEIRREPQAFVARNRRVDRLQQRYTTGTSGEPLQFYVDHDELQREWAFACHQWNRVGYEPGDARAELIGRRIEGPKPYFWDPVPRALRLSPIVHEKDTVSLYLDRMQSYGIRFLYGYPSAITYFASLIRRHGVRVGAKLTAVLFASETLYPWQRMIAQEVFDCRTYSFYGLAEHVVIAGECEASRAYHFMPQYGIAEVDSQTGEIAGTGFLNHANPFIRYRTSDIAALPAGSGCPACGRQYYPMAPDIEGRLQDFVLTPDGASFNSCTLTFPFKERKTIGRVQLVQETLDRVILRVAPLGGDRTRQFLDELGVAHNTLQQILGHEVTVKDEIISSDESTGSGKFRFIVSHLPSGLRCYDRNPALGRAEWPMPRRHSSPGAG